MKKRLLVVSILCLLLLVGCNKQEKEQADTFITMKREMVQGITLIYSPKSNADIIQGRDMLSKYLTEEAYGKLLVELGEYNEAKSGVQMKDVLAAYIRKENSENNLFDKLNITFYLVDGEKKQMVAIEFVKDASDLYSDYQIYRGFIETSS